MVSLLLHGLVLPDVTGERCFVPEALVAVGICTLERQLAGVRADVHLQAALGGEALAAPVRTLERLISSVSPPPQVLHFVAAQVLRQVAALAEAAAADLTLEWPLARVDVRVLRQVRPLPANIHTSAHVSASSASPQSEEQLRICQMFLQHQVAPHLCEVLLAAGKEALERLELLLLIARPVVLFLAQLHSLFPPLLPAHRSDFGLFGPGGYSLVPGQDTCVHARFKFKMLLFMLGSFP